MQGFKKFAEDSVSINKFAFEETDRYKILKMLITNGVEIEKCMNKKVKVNTPLHWSIYHGDFKSSLLLYKLLPNQIYYLNQDGIIPFDIPLECPKSKILAKDGIWIIEGL